ELQKTNLGYIFSRAEMLQLVNFDRRLSRVFLGAQDLRHKNDSWGLTTQSGYWLAGRNILNMWRILRKQVNLREYSLESVARSVLKRRLPKYSLKTLHTWFHEDRYRRHVRQVLSMRCRILLEIVDKLNLVVKTAQMARVIGTDFFSVLSRGSQFEVEGVM